MFYVIVGDRTNACELVDVGIIIYETALRIGLCTCNAERVKIVCA